MKKVAFTGGPGSGKSTVIAALKQEYGQLIQVAPEVATLLIKGGFPIPTSERQRIALQTAIVHTQRQLEVALEEQAKDNQSKALLTDRAILDGAVYWPHGLADFMKVFQVNHDDVMSYAKIIVLRLNDRAYTTANNEARTESLDQALELEAKIIKLYGNYSNVEVIPPRNTIWATASQVAKIIGVEDDH